VTKFRKACALSSLGAGESARLPAVSVAEPRSKQPPAVFGLWRYLSDLVRPCFYEISERFGGGAYFLAAMAAEFKQDS